MKSVVAGMEAGPGRGGRALAVAAVTLALGLAACGGGGGSGVSPVAPTAPVGPSQSKISVTVADPVVDVSSRAGYTYDLRFNLTVAETAGLAANFNFIRAEFYSTSGAMIERQEVTATQLGRVPASQSLTAPILISFNSDPNPGRYAVVTCNFTDDRANSLAAQVRINF